MTSRLTGPTEYRVPFSGVGYCYEPDDIAVVIQAMAERGSLTQGKNQLSFEQEFETYLGSGYCFATSSAASAIELCAVLSQIGPGDEVIIPAHTYTASAYPFARRGAKIRWADIDPETFVMSLESVTKLISDRTKLIVAVHLYGSPVDIEELSIIAKRNSIILVEDCAQSIGARVDEKPVGTFGDLSVFSFQSHKNISTLGEGGMLWVREPKLATLVPGLRHNGHRPYERPDGRYWIPAMSDVEVDIPGEWPHNFCLGEAQSALGRHLLTKVERINSKRRSRYFIAREVLADYPEIRFQKIAPPKVSSHHLLPFRYDPLWTGRSNHDFISELAFKRGIQPAVQYLPLNRYGLYKKFGLGEAEVPNTDDFFDNMVSLPFHVWMTDVDFEYMISQVAEVAQSFRR